MIPQRTLVVLALSAITFAATPAFAQDGLPNVTALFKAQKSSVVSIQTEVASQQMPFFGRTSPGVGQGSGFVVDRAGYVVTNNHVIEGATSIRVALDTGETFDGQLIGTDPKTDIAVVKIDAGRPLPAVTLGESSTLEVGQWVVAIGNPFGLDYSVTAGIVSAKGRNIGAGPYDDFIQTDASINPGNSGGPLFDMNGRVVGVNTAIIKDGAGIGFSVPVDIVKDLLPQLKAHGYVVRGFIGTGIQDLSDELAESFGVPRSHGVLIGAIEDAGPAADAGMRPGDIVVSFGGERVRTTQELLRAVARSAPGKRADVVFVRDGKNLTAKLLIAERPDAKQPRALPVKSRPEAASSRTGLVLRPVDQRVARAMGMRVPTGLLVERVLPGSAASKVLQPGDVIVEARGHRVDSPDQLDAHAAKTKKGQVMRMLILRDGRTQFVGLRL